MNALPDPVTLMFMAPVIEPGEDWRDRSLATWSTMTGHEGFLVEPVPDFGPFGPARHTWCGSVRVSIPDSNDGGVVYRIHRTPMKRTYGGLSGGLGWVVVDTVHAFPALDLPSSPEVHRARNDL